MDVTWNEKEFVCVDTDISIVIKFIKIIAYMGINVSTLQHESVLWRKPIPVGSCDMILLYWRGSEESQQGTWPPPGGHF